MFCGGPYKTTGCYSGGAIIVLEQALFCALEMTKNPDYGVDGPNSRGRSFSVDLGTIFGHTE